MKIKTILAIILFVVSLMSIITSVSALVVEINSQPTDTNLSSLESDNLYEEQLRYPVYDEWICVNNKLQRSVVQYNLENIEYGQPCGYVLESTDKNVPIKDIFWYLAIIVLVILILMAIVLIAMFLLGSR